MKKWKWYEINELGGNIITASVAFKIKTNRYLADDSAENLKTKDTKKWVIKL